MTRPYNVVDADGHILEPLDLWDTYIDPEFRERRPRFVIDDNGKERLSVEGKLLGNPRGIGSLGSVGVRQGEVTLDSLKYADGRFAGVAAHLVFLFIPKPEVALREMRRVTRSGGTVAAVVWDSRGGLVFQRMLWDTAVAIDPNARVARDSLFANPVAIPGGLAGFFRDAGLEDVETQSLTIRMEYENFEDYWQPFLAGQGPVGAYFANLAPALNARIKAAVRDAYCSGAPDGPRSLAASAWAVRGKVP